MNGAIEPLVARIAEDRRAGASELARRALQLVADRAVYQADTTGGTDRIFALARALRDCRPAMAPIANLLDRWLEAAADVPENPEALAQLARRLIAEAGEAVFRLGKLAHAERPEGASLLAHSWSSTLLELGRAWGPAGRWWVNRSEPDGEGRTLALELARAGARVTLVTEAQAEWVLPRVTALVTGADSLLADGSVINKSGTALMARAAADWGVPYLCLCETLKQTRAWHFDAEPRSAEALDPPRHERLDALNLTFDRTPVNLVSAWITESGVRRNPQARIPWPVTNQPDQGASVSWHNPG